MSFINDLCPNKPSTAISIVDSDGNQTYQWVVPFNECAVAAAVYDTTNTNLKYEVFLNPNRKVYNERLIIFSPWLIQRNWLSTFKSVADGANSIRQMEQVKFTCTVPSLIIETEIVTIVDPGSTISTSTISTTTEKIILIPDTKDEIDDHNSKYKSENWMWKLCMWKLYVKIILQC